MSLKEILPLEVFLLIGAISYLIWSVWLPDLIFRSTSKEKVVFIIIVIFGYVMVIDYFQLILHTLFLAVSFIMFFYFKVKMWEALWKFWLINFEKILVFIYLCVFIFCIYALAKSAKYVYSINFL